MNVRDRTTLHLERLRQTALTSAGAALASGCLGYKVVDPLPDSEPCSEDALLASVEATAAWTADGTVAITVSADAELDDPEIDGGAVLSSTPGWPWSGEIQPADGATSVTLTFSARCGPSSETFTVTLDVSGTPSEGGTVPTSVAR